MSFTLYFAKLRDAKPRTGLMKEPVLGVGAFRSQLSAKRGAQVALPQSPILRDLRSQYNPKVTMQRNEKKALPPKQKVLPMSGTKSVTDVLTAPAPTPTLNLKP